MVTHPTARRDVFQAIADPHRRAIIHLLARQALTLNEVAAHFAVSRPAISKHIKILVECGLVTIEQRGRERHCTVTLDSLAEVMNWVEQSRSLWTARLDTLADYLAELQKQQTEQKHGRKQHPR